MGSTERAAARGCGWVAVALLVAVQGASVGCRDADHGGDRYRIPYTEIDTVTIAAARGDVKAAFRLYEYYEFYTHEHAPAVRWLRVAAKAGDLEAAWTLGRLLADYEAPAEGVHWLKSAASRGHERARADLENIERSARSNKAEAAPK